MNELTENTVNQGIVSDKAEADLPDFKIAGSGTLGSGDYGDVRISGSGTLNGEVMCRSFHASGAVKGGGNLTVSGEFHCSGSYKVEGELSAAEISVSGSANLTGPITASESLTISGSLVCEKVRAGELKVSGGIRTDGDVEAEYVSISGSGSIGGLLNAEEIQIQDTKEFSVGYDSKDSEKVRGKLTIGSIGGSTIRISRKGGGIFGKMFQKPSINPFVVTDSIEGDEIDIDGVRAKRVSGKNVRIRRNCEIESVEFSDSLEIEEGAVVRKQLHV